MAKDMVRHVSVLWHLTAVKTSIITVALGCNGSRDRVRTVAALPAMRLTCPSHLRY
jgi:hypothetical protein